MVFETATGTIAATDVVVVGRFRIRRPIPVLRAAERDIGKMRTGVRPALRVMVVVISSTEV